METNSWDQSREYFLDVDSALKSELSEKWMKIPPSNEMKCESFTRLRERVKNCINLFLEEEDKILIKHKILLTRDEINKLWSLCWSTENDKLSFKEYSSEIYSQDVLDKHESYKKHLECVYNSNSELFSLVKRYVETLNHHKELEIEQNDPKRLFKNRGAQLLKNDKELKEGKRELIRLEGNITRLSSKHNQKYGKQLLIHGEKVMDWLNRLRGENESKSTVKSRVRPWHTANSASTFNLESSARKKTKLEF